MNILSVGFADSVLDYSICCPVFFVILSAGDLVYIYNYVYIMCVSIYIYTHCTVYTCYLNEIGFPSQPGSFFRCIRSRTASVSSMPRDTPPPIAASPHPIFP